MTLFTCSRSRLAFEGKDGIAGAHKWFAISASRLQKVDKKAAKCPKLNEQIGAHAKKATELDPKVSHIMTIITMCLGPVRLDRVGHRAVRKEGLQGGHRVVAKKPKGSSPTPQLFTIWVLPFQLQSTTFPGDAQRLVGSKAEATETLKKAYATPSKDSVDSRAKSEAKRILLTKLKQKPEDIDFVDPKY